MELVLPEKVTALIRKEYSLNLISPMAMHGADPRGNAEFRPASLKGILRYWWRSLQLESNHSKLLASEVLLFGGIETENKRKSPVSIMILEPIRGENSENLLPHRPKSNNDPKRRPVYSKTIDKNSRITLYIQTLKGNKDTLTIYENYMNYMLHLTGMGQRSRRGFGACQWEEHKWETPGQFAQSLKNVLTTLHVEQQFSWNNDGPILLKRKSSVHVNHPVLEAVYIGAGKDSVQEVLKMIGKASHIGNPNGNLGSAKRRWASPLWCTIRKIGFYYYPIITEMVTDGGGIKNIARYEHDRNTFLQKVGVEL